MRDKIIIVTGASSGIGKACAFEFASRGAKLAIAARRYDILKQIETEVKAKYSSDIISIKTDISIEEDCKNLVATTLKEYGRIDILLCNAGISMRALFKDMDLKVLHRVMDVNFWGMIYCTKYAQPYLLESKGSVAVISSVSGYTPIPARTGYCASKYAIHGFIESLRLENLRTGLHVMLIAPGFTASEIRKNALTANGNPQAETPREESRMQSPARVACRIAQGIVKRKRTMIISNLGWWTIAVNKFFPRFVDKMIYRNFAKEPDTPF
ncbi:MAG: SDR family oxidoreductase [Bacteroidia bacterium]|nr:SDR family oxidoreductase [Bacteroidia bacterium]